MLLWAFINLIIEKIIRFFKHHKVIAVIVLLIAYLCLIGTAASKLSVPLQDRYNIEDCKSYIVKPGDTLWDISVEYAPNNIRIEEYIELLKITSGKKDAALMPGEVLAIPILGEGDNN